MLEKHCGDSPSSDPNFVAIFSISSGVGIKLFVKILLKKCTCTYIGKRRNSFADHFMSEWK